MSLPPMINAGCINKPNGDCGCGDHPPAERARLVRAAEAIDAANAWLGELDDVWVDAMDWSPPPEVPRGWFRGGCADCVAYFTIKYRVLPSVAVRYNLYHSVECPQLAQLQAAQGGAG